MLKRKGTLLLSMRFIGGKSGQTLIEILIAVTVAAVLIGSAATLISVSLRASSENEEAQTALFLTSDLLEKATVLAEKDWLLIDTPGTYCLDTQGGGLAIVSCPVSIAIDGTSYDRSFVVEDVYRTKCGSFEVSNPPTGPPTNPCDPNIQTTSKPDPLTKKVIATVQWISAGGSQSLSLVKYITRHANFVFRQSDWLGGPTAPPGSPTPPGSFIAVVSATSTTDRFASSTGMNFTTGGSISISP